MGMERTLFARKATGLVRELGLGAAIVIALTNTIGLGWQRRVFQAVGAGAVPREDYFVGLPPIVMSFILIGIVVLISVYAYAILSAAMPRSGGGYVYISRIVNPSFGFVAGWLEFLSIAVSYGIIATAVLEGLVIFGGLPGPNSLLGVFQAVNTPVLLSVGGVVIMAIFAYIAILGTRLLWQVLRIIFIIPASILVLVYLTFILASPQSMEAGVQALSGGHSATEYTQAALSAGLAPTAEGYWGAVFAAFPYAYWAYIGYAAASFVAGEVKEAGRNLPRAMLAAGGIIVAIYVTIAFLLVNSGFLAGAITTPQGTWGLVDAVGFLRFGGCDACGGAWPDNVGLPGLGHWMPVFAAISANGGGLFGLPGELFGWLVILFGVLWVANDIPPFILTSSRIIFAMGFDRIIPETLSEVNETYHTPVNAILAAFVVGIFGAVSEADLFPSLGLPAAITSFFSSSGAIEATDLWDIAFFAGMGLACALFPLRKPDIFARAPFKASSGLVQLVGWLAVAGNLFVAYILIFRPEAYNTFSEGGWLSGDLYTILTAPFSYTIYLIIIGYILYLWGQNRAKGMGADLSTIYAEIPPE